MKNVLEENYRRSLEHNIRIDKINFLIIELRHCLLVGTEHFYTVVVCTINGSYKFFSTLKIGKFGFIYEL